MKKQFLTLIIAVSGFGISLDAASGSNITRGGMPTQPSVEPVDLLYETFANVSGDGVSTPVDASKFDNSGEWTFTDAFAADGGVIIRKGGSVTTPPIEALTGNATIYFSTQPSEDEDHPIEWDNLRPHSLSVVNGDLNQSTLDEMVSMESIYIYGAGPETRVTLTADHDIKLTSVKLYYGGVGGNFYDRYTKVSVPEGEYFNPFEVTLTPYMGQGVYNDDGSHNITVYTIDGTMPTRTSTRYDGNPIKIDRTTTLQTGTIFGNGALSIDKPVEYTLPQSSIPEIPANTFTVNVAKPGTLKSLLLDIDADEINGLVLSGKINSEDLAYLSSAQGRVANIQYLDLAELTFDYDGGHYATQVFAPEGGMGTVSTLYYYLSEENRNERLAGGPMNENTACYRNNLAAAFAKSKLTRVVTPKCITAIGESSFPTVAMATIPDNVTAIGSNAFSNCEYIELPATIKSIGAYAFGSKLIMNKIELPAIEYIGYGAFAEAKVSSFILGDKLSYIGEAAFYGTKITEAVMSMPTDTIPASLFAECTELRKVEITGDVKVIGEKAFAGSNNIESFSIPSSIEVVGLDAIPDYLLDAPEDGIIYVGKTAYKRVDDLTSAKLREGTVSITDALFSASVLSEITIPASVKYIGDAAFSGTQLKSTPEMPGVVRIGRGAFAYCPQLARIHIPENVEFIGSSAFDGCNAAWSLQYDAIDAETDYLGFRDLERIVIGDKVRRLPRGIYTQNTGITDAVLPRSMEIIEPEAFLGCVNLRSIRFSDNITKISDRAFFNCRSLSDIHWPARLDSIGESAFSECAALKTVSLPEGLRSVGSWAFAYCPEVSSLYIASTVEQIGYGAFYFENHDKQFTITSTAEIPPYYEWTWVYYNEAPTIKVPVAYMESYRTEPWWSGSNAGINVNLVAIGEIEAPKENSSTEFSTLIAESSDLGDTVIGDVYVTLGENDVYDESDGAIVLGSTMDEEYAEAIGGMAPGASDLHNRFNGLVVMVPAGRGLVAVNCQTIGSRLVTVKFGDDEPSFFTKDSKGDITIDYDVSADTYVYIYASEDTADKQMKTRAGEGDCIRIYSIGVSPENTAVDSISGADGKSPFVEYYTLDGIRIENPSYPGIYIGRRADGSTSKVYLR